MPAHMPVIEVLNTEIVQYLEDIGKIEQRKIGSVCLAHLVLHRQIDPENKKRLYQQVDKDQECDINQKFATHFDLRVRSCGVVE